ncbi:MAG: hypothetical protein PVG66_11910 [Chromatiales bacterium]
MTELKNINGHHYPKFDRGWGGCAEELFHYTSRYYRYTEAFLRNLSGNCDLSMSGFQARLLSPAQRELMAAVLSTEPCKCAAVTINSIITMVQQGKKTIHPGLADRYRKQLDAIPEGVTLKYRQPHLPAEKPGVAPLDPFLNLAERLLMPVAVVDHHVEVSLHTLAEHLDSPNSRIRTNLQEAVLQLHNGGYCIRNHPHLTHKEAEIIASNESG